MSLRWTHEARDDLLSIASIVSQRNEKTARRWVRLLRTQAARATRLPRSGRVVPEFGRSDLREFLYRGYRIVHLLREDDVVVLTVFEDHRQLRLTERDVTKAKG